MYSLFKGPNMFISKLFSFSIFHILHYDYLYAKKSLAMNFGYFKYICIINFTL